jgi:hypothetical protein
VDKARPYSELTLASVRQQQRSLPSQSDGRQYPSRYLVTAPDIPFPDTSLCVSETSQLLPTTKKRSRPGPKGRNNITFNDGCCN